MRKKTLNERIQEELQYSEVLNTKIKKIEKKATERKAKTKKNKNIYSFIKEYNYLKENQKKTENELLVHLFDLTSTFQEENNDIMKDYYQLINMEKTISLEFKQILSIVKTNITELKSSQQPQHTLTTKTVIGIEKLFTTLHEFLTNIKTLNKTDYDLLTSSTTSTTNDDDDAYASSSSSNEISLLFQNDVMNTMGINEIDYLIQQELHQAEKNATLLIPFNHPEFTLSPHLSRIIKETYLSFPFITFKLNSMLTERALITLGELKTQESINNITRSFELVNLKYKKDYDIEHTKLLNELIQITKQSIPLKIKLKTSNIVYFLKHFDNTETFNQKLSNTNITAKPVITQYTIYKSFLDFLSSHRNTIQHLVLAYMKETNELRASSLKLLNDDINTEIANRRTQIAKYDFEQRKKEMTAIHLKNKEIYEIKQKMKKEKEDFMQKLHDKKEQEKERKEQQRRDINKLKTEHYKEQKKINEQKENEKMQMYIKQQKQKQREEVEAKLPNIIQRHIQSTNMFINNQMHKEFIKEQKEYNEQRLNYIIENYKSRPHVEADPKRLVAITENLQNRYMNIHGNVKEPDEKAKMFEHNGFTVEHLMKDFRYKVSSALFEAGIQDKQYSKELMRNLAFANSNNNNPNFVSQLNI